jgi:hypothetical protein
MAMVTRRRIEISISFIGRISYQKFLNKKLTAENLDWWSDGAMLTIHNSMTPTRLTS